MKATTRSILQRMRKRPGHISACGLFGGLLAFTYMKGPSIESQVAKYILAGTTATVTIELASHFIDTINMRSKIVDSQHSFYGKPTQ